MIELMSNVRVSGGRARFLGLRMRSTGFVPERSVIDAARSVLALYAKWDDARFKALFTKQELRDKLKERAQKLRAELGSCRLANDVEKTRSGNGEHGALFPITCDKGAPSELLIAQDKDGKLMEPTFRPRNGPRQRCVEPSTAAD